MIRPEPIRALVLVLPFVLVRTGNAQFEECKSTDTNICQQQPSLTAVESNANIQFNFSNPGARSLGLGGAFLALANDATAAYTNPAGLTILNMPEISFEIRGFNFSHIFLDGGRALAVNGPTLIGIDNHVGLQFGDARSDTLSLSFISAVFATDRFAIAAYRRQAADFQIAFATQGAFFSPDLFRADPEQALQIPTVILFPEANDLIIHEFADTRLFPIETSLNFELVDIGVSGAFKFGEDVSLGIGLSFYNLLLESSTERYFFSSNVLGTLVDLAGQVVFVLDRTTNALDGSFYGPPFISPSNVLVFERQSGNDKSIAASLGILWRIGDKWTLGGAYRQGPDFEITSRTTSVARRFDTLRTGSLRVPDIYGIGVAFRLRPNIRASFDYDWVRYSQLAASFNIPTQEADLYEISDGNEFHVGFEWIHVPVVFRFGFWRDPDHSLRFIGDDVVERARFPGGQARNHYAAGVGIIAGSRFSVDAAFDYSESLTTSSISAVIRF